MWEEYFLGDECSSDSAKASPLEGKSIFLPLLSSPLVQLKRSLTLLSCCPSTRAKLGKPLKQAECLTSDDRDTHSPSGVAHYFPQHCIGLAFPACSTSKSSTS